MEIGGQNRILVELTFERQRQPDLLQFAAEGAGGASVESSRYLHGEGRATGNDAPIAEPLPSGAEQGERIDAGMLIKALIFDGQQAREITRIDGIRRDRQSPTSRCDRKSAEQAAVAVEALRGGGNAQIGQRCGVDPVLKSQPEAGAQGTGKQREEDAGFQGGQLPCGANLSYGIGDAYDNQRRFIHNTRRA